MHPAVHSGMGRILAMVLFVFGVLLPLGLAAAGGAAAPAAEAAGPMLDPAEPPDDAFPDVLPHACDNLSPSLGSREPRARDARSQRASRGSLLPEPRAPPR